MGENRCKNPVDFDPVPIGIGNEIVDSIGTIIINLSCGLLGGWCEAKDGWLKPSSNADYFEAQQMALLGMVSPAGDLADDISSSVVKVFRVEGHINQRINILEDGMVELIGDNMLFLNFGNEERAIEFFNKRLAQGIDDATIKSFTVSNEFLQLLRDNAVPEQLAREFPNAPLVVDISKAADQYGLRPEQIEQILDFILPNSGQITRP